MLIEIDDKPIQETDQTSKVKQGVENDIKSNSIDKEKLNVL